jgi:hypothetical protein
LSKNGGTIKKSVIIHALLFAWNLIGNFFTVLEAPWFRGFPDHNRNLFVTSITINTRLHSDAVFGMFSSMAILYTPRFFQEAR